MSVPTSPSPAPPRPSRRSGRDSFRSDLGLTSSIDDLGVISSTCRKRSRPDRKILRIGTLTTFMVGDGPPINRTVHQQAPRRRHDRGRPTRNGVSLSTWTAPTTMGFWSASIPASRGSSGHLSGGSRRSSPPSSPPVPGRWPPTARRRACGESRGPTPIRSTSSSRHGVGGTIPAGSWCIARVITPISFRSSVHRSRRPTCCACCAISAPSILAACPTPWDTSCPRDGPNSAPSKRRWSATPSADGMASSCSARPCSRGRFRPSPLQACSRRRCATCSYAFVYRRSSSTP